MISRAILAVALFFLAPLSAQTLGPWVNRASGNTNRLTGIADGRAGLVAVGHGGAVELSADGVSWRSLTIQGTDFRGVAYGNGIYVAIGIPDTYATVDGFTWTKFGSGSPIVAPTCITFADGKFIVAGGSGNLTISTNGRSWSPAFHMGYNDAVLALVPGWLALGNSGGALFSSANATNWFRQTMSESSARLVAGARGGGGWAILGEDPNRIYTAQADTWTTRFSWTSDDLNAVAWGANQFLVVGDRGLTINSPSLEGRWRTIERAAGTLRAVTFARGSFFAVGDNGYIAERFAGDASQLQIAAHPQDIAVGAGDPVILSARAVASQPINYQWLFNGAAIEGATSAELWISGARVEDAGAYRLRASVGEQSVLSEEAVLSVMTRPVVTINPPAEGVFFNAQDHRMSARVLSDRPITHVEYHLAEGSVYYNGQTILATADAPPYEVAPALRAGMEHVFYAVAWTDRGVPGTSAPVSFSVLWNSAISIGQDRLLFLGTETTVQSSGWWQLTNFQWYKDGAPIPGANAAQLSVVADTMERAGAYKLIAWGADAGGESPSIRVDIVPPPDFSSLRAPPSRIANYSAYSAMAAGDGILVGIQLNGRFSASRDGITWRQIPMPDGTSLRRVRFLNGEFWAVGAIGSEGAAFRSSDGVVWDTALPTGGAPWNDIAFSNGAYAIVGSDRIAHASNGRDWTFASVASEVPIISIAAGDGRFVAARANRAVLSSSDGAAWTETEVPDAGNFQNNLQVEFCNGRFVLLQQFGVMTSDGLSAWESAAGPFAPGAAYRFALPSPSKLILVPESSNQEFLVTTDGSQFAAVTGSSFYSPRSAVFDGARFWLSDVNQGTHRLLRSSDGIGWVHLPQTITIPAAPEAFWAGDRFYLAGRFGALGVSDGDGDWRGEIALPGAGTFRTVFHTGERYVAVDSSRNIWSSDNGAIFTRQPLLARGTNVVFADGEFLSFEGQTIFRSDDAVTWRQQTVAATVHSITKGAGVVVAGVPGGRYVSSAGEAFVARGEAGVTHIYMGSAYGNGRFVQVGEWNGWRFQSAVSVNGGVDWTQAEALPAAVYRLNALTFSGGMFLLPGKGGKLAYSLDGRAWHQAQLSTSVDLLSAAFGADGTLVVTGQGGYLRQTGILPGADRLRLTLAMEEGAELRFAAPSGSFITIEESPSLQPGSWTRIHSAFVGAEEERISISPDGANRFFRAFAE